MDRLLSLKWEETSHWLNLCSHDDVQRSHQVLLVSYQGHNECRFWVELISILIYIGKLLSWWFHIFVSHGLTHLSLVPHICVGEQGQHCLIPPFHRGRRVPGHWAESKFVTSGHGPVSCLSSTDEFRPTPDKCSMSVRSNRRVPIKQNRPMTKVHRV